MSKNHRAECDETDKRVAAHVAQTIRANCRSNSGTTAETLTPDFLKYDPAMVDDLGVAGIDVLTIGQYPQPAPKHHPVTRHGAPEEFAAYKAAAKGKGFLPVSAFPLARSSFHADADFQHLHLARSAACVQLGQKAESAR